MRNISNWPNGQIVEKKRHVLLGNFQAQQTIYPEMKWSSAEVKGLL